MYEVRKMANVGSQEIKISEKEINTSISNLKNISVRLANCKSQKFLLNESIGETAAQAKNMYDEVLYVIGAMQEVVDQTATLLENAALSFKEAETEAITQYIEKI